MPTAALYDIHGNLPALDAVLADLDASGADRVVVGGDVVAGPFPSETLRRLRDLAVPTYYLRGNAEAEALRAAAGRAPGGLSERADEEARWLAATLSATDLAFIATWPPTVDLVVPPWGRVLFCHATPGSDSRVFTERTPEAALAPLFEGVDADLAVCGHTHLPFDRAAGSRRVVNAGSVGMPFGRTGADWLLLGDAVEFRHTDYDLADAAGRVRRSGYPHADAFAQRSVESVPGKAAALAMLAALEEAQSGEHR